MLEIVSYFEMLKNAKSNAKMLLNHKIGCLRRWRISEFETLIDKIVTSMK